MNKLEKKIKERELSMYKIAQHFGCSPTAIEYKIRKKDYARTIEELNTFAELLECEVKDLI